MIKLHGFALSNNYNKVKLALLEKGVAFEEVYTAPSKDDAFLQRSPMGKIPFIEDDGRFLSESQAIVEYIDETRPGPKLMPADPWQRAVCRQTLDVIEEYMSVHAMRCVGAVFFGAPLSDEAKADVRANWERAVGALQRLIRFEPYALGQAFTALDCAAFPHFGLFSVMSKTLYGTDVMDALPGLAQYQATMMTRPAVQKVVADQTAAYQAFEASRKK